MNDKAFTLVELLGVIVILAIIFILTFPSVNSIINSSKDTTYKKQINTILDATYDWSLKNINKLPDSNNKTFLTLGELKINGLIDVNITNPNTREPFSDDLVISINNVGLNYKTSDINSKLKGDYLYKVEIELMSSTTFINKKPIIELLNLSANSAGDYVTTIDINTNYEDAEYVATSSEGIDLTSKVTVNIIYNNKLVENVNTSKAGIYHINYTVIDEDGYSNTVVRNVIITDDLPPVITLPEENSISTVVTSFDLMNGVTCKDNSGNCKITTSGEIKFGVSGKYIIEYTAKDPSGNTSKLKRVITVE